MGKIEEKNGKKGAPNRSEFGNSLPEPTEPTVCQNGSAEPTRRCITSIGLQIRQFSVFLSLYWWCKKLVPTLRYFYPYTSVRMVYFYPHTGVKNYLH